MGFNLLHLKKPKYIVLFMFEKKINTYIGFRVLH